MGGGVQAGDGGQRGRQEAALQGRDEDPQLRRARARPPAGPQQLPLVGPPVAGVEDRGPDQQRLPGGPVLTTEVTSTGSRVPSARPQLQGHAADLALHGQQRREVRLVVDPAADGEQVGEPAGGPPAHRGRSRASPAACR